MIIDAHSHYMPPAVAENTMFFKVGWSDIDRQLSAMDAVGIDRALLVYPTSDAHLNMGGWKKVCQVYNAAIADVVKTHPDRFIGAGILPVDAPEIIPRELKRIQDLNLKVLSMASSYDGIFLNDERFHSAYEFAQSHDMPIHIHSQIMNPIGEDRVRDPLLTPVLEYVFDVSMCIGRMMMNGTFLKYPDGKFIFAHYGGVLPLVKERFDSTYQMLRKREFVKDLTRLPSAYFQNLYFDTSGSKSVASLLCALEVVDASHLLFGSDFPANPNLEAALAAIDQVEMDDRQKSAIKSSNLLMTL